MMTGEPWTPVFQYTHQLTLFQMLPDVVLAKEGESKDVACRIQHEATVVQGDAPCDAHPAPFAPAFQTPTHIGRPLARSAR
jgi:hypothetical protein